MDYEQKYMTALDFQKEGFLQEANRQFFHPLGLALEVSVDNDQIKLGRIWDSRDDNEGIYFVLKEEELSRAQENARKVEELRQQKADARLDMWGWVIQPIAVNHDADKA